MHHTISLKVRSSYHYSIKQKHAEIKPYLGRVCGNENLITIRLITIKFHCQASLPKISLPRHSSKNFIASPFFQKCHCLAILPKMSLPRHSSENFIASPFFQKFHCLAILPKISLPRHSKTSLPSNYKISVPRYSKISLPCYSKTSLLCLLIV